MVVSSTLIQSLLQLPVSYRQLYVAYSGGLDSTVLLHALAQLHPNLITAIHIHHGLSSNADAWVRHCQTETQKLNIPLRVLHVQAKAQPGQSPEAAAREARYQAFAEILRADDVLVLAHHCDDQAETLLLQLLRGAGVRGLAAMPSLTEFNGAWLSRPLLTLSRQQLELYAKEHGLCWIEDESNTNTDFDRNYLRQHIMPLLQTRWPAVAENMSRAASHCAEADRLNQTLAEMDYAMVEQGVIDMSLSCQRKLAPSPTIPSLNIPQLLKLPEPRQRNLIRYWLRQHHLPMPSTTKIQQILKTVLHSRDDANPVVHWPHAEVRRFRHHLYAMPPLPFHDPEWQQEWNVKEDLVLPANLGTLKATDYQPLAAGLPLTIKFRQGGERIQLPNQTHHHDLKKLLQEWGIPTWQRSRIPLIYRDGVLVHLVR